MDESLLPGVEAPSQARLDLAQANIAHYESTAMSTGQKLITPMRFMSRQSLAKVICYLDLVRTTQGVTGSIVECGVYFGNGLMTFAKLLAALEPYNYKCQVIGFDTFEGNTDISDKDFSGVAGQEKRDGGYFADSYQELLDAIGIFDQDRPLNQFPKVHLVKGDVMETAPQYVADNQHLLVRLLSLDMNLYEPTVASLKAFLPRMGKGSAIMMTSLNSSLYPGMVTAVLEELNIRDYRWVTPSFYPIMNYVIL